MNLDEKYRAWQERPAPLNLPPDFAGDVMRRIHRDAGQSHAQWNWPRLLESFQQNVGFQYAALALAAIAGLSRLWLIFFAILKP